MAHLLSTSPVPRLLSQVSCLMSPVSLSCLLSHVSCLTPPVSRPLSQVSCLTSPVTCLLSQVSCIACCVFFKYKIISELSGVTVGRAARSDAGGHGFKPWMVFILKIPKLSAINALKSPKIPKFSTIDA